MSTPEFEIIQEALTYLRDSLDQLNPKDGYKNQSVQVKELMSALSLAQGEYLRVKKDGVETASLDAIMTACRPALAKNGLSFTQMLLDDNDGDRRLITRLGHSSGQWFESMVKIKPLRNDKNQEQSNAATLLFMRKETAKAILGVTIPNDMQDDDADCLFEEPSLDDLDEVMSNPRTPAKKSELYISNEQMEDLNHELASFPEIAKSLLKKLNITQLSHMKRSDFRKHIDEVRRLKIKYQKTQEVE